MQASLTRSESSALLDAAPPASWSVCPPTPLVQLVRSGEGLVFLKHEGFQPSGSVYDRWLAHQVPHVEPGERFVTQGANAYTYAAAAYLASRGGHLVVHELRGQERRLRTLLRAYDAEVRVHDTLAELTRALDDATWVGARLLDRYDPKATRDALNAVRAEVVAGHHAPIARWVVPDWGLARNTLAEVLGAPVVTVPDDRERRRNLTGAAAARRQQVGHREGILLSPLGAELVEAAVNEAAEVAGPTVVLLPEGGRRYVGWW